MCMPQMTFQKPAQIPASDCCADCDELIDSVRQIKYGTPMFCERCANAFAGAGMDKEER